MDELSVSDEPVGHRGGRGRDDAASTVGADGRPATLSLGIERLDAAPRWRRIEERRLGEDQATLEALASDIADERADDAWLEAQERVLDELVRRTEVPLTVELVDEEIRQSWQASESRLLVSKNFGPDELQESLDGWLNDPNTRLETERRLRIAFALRAIIERDGVRLTPEALDEVLEEAVVPFGLSLEEARRALEDPELADGIRNSALQVVAVKHVMARAEIQFEGVPGRFSGTGKPLR